MKNRLFMESAVGLLVIEEEDGAVTGLGFAGNNRKEAEPDKQKSASSALLERAAEELEEYFAGKRRAFTIPLRPVGTPFQRRVWEELRRIPYGETRTYGEIAVLAGSPRGARAVGMACNRNPILILIPCHRVIGADGSLTGFGGGLPVKEKLLSLEAAPEREDKQSK